MNKLPLYFIIISLFLFVVPAHANINGQVSAHGKPLENLSLTLSKVSLTQDEAGRNVYSFQYMLSTNTDKNGKYEFTAADVSAVYRVNVTYQNLTFGKNVHDGETANFNLSGTITGSVFHFERNKTLASIPVNLWDEDGVMVASTLTNDAGKYVFNNVNIGNYTVEAIYEGVSYAETVMLPYNKSINFTVYDTSDNRNMISVILDHIILSRAPNGILVREFVKFRNDGDKVFYSPNRVWLGISTPPGITNFQTDIMECCLRRDKDAAWIDPMKPLMPGETYGVQISYTFNPQSEEAFFNKEMLYNTSYFSLISDKNNGFGIESRFAKKETVSEQGKEYEILTLLNLPRGQLIDIQIIGFVPSKTDTKELNYIIPVLAILITGAVLYPFVRNKLTRKTKRKHIKQEASTKPAASVKLSTDEPMVAEGFSNTADDLENKNISEKTISDMSFDELLAEKNSVFEAILNLENEFNAGKIQEEEYKELKKEYREKAILVLKQLKETALNIDLAQPVPVIEKIIAHVDDINILERILEREKHGENRDEIKELIEERIEDIEQTQ